MWNRIIKYLCNGGVTSEFYRMIEPDIVKNNSENLRKFTSLCAAAFFGMLIVSLFTPSLEKNRLVYILAMVLNMLLMVIAFVPCRSNTKLVLPCVYVFLMVLLWFGVMLCTVIEPNEVAVSFVILLFAMPLLFTDRPIHMIMLIIAGIFMYVWAEEWTLTRLEDTERACQVRGYNLTNIIPYGILSMVVSSYMMRIKIERFIYIQKNKLLSETDQMTGLLNRRSYSMHLEKLREEAPDDELTVCSIDVNELKVTNDTMGHSAGDELICGAARCIIDVLGEYGLCFRIGGDEFIAILHDNHQVDELRRMLYDKAASWHGRVVDSLSLSVGIIKNTDKLGIDELVSQADADMYTEKAKHYWENGHKRR